MVESPVNPYGEFTPKQIDAIWKMSHLGPEKLNPEETICLASARAQADLSMTYGINTSRNNISYNRNEGYYGYIKPALHRIIFSSSNAAPNADMFETVCRKIGDISALLFFAGFIPSNVLVGAGGFGLYAAFSPKLFGQRKQ